MGFCGGSLNILHFLQKVAKSHPATPSPPSLLLRSALHLHYHVIFSDVFSFAVSLADFPDIWSRDELELLYYQGLWLKLEVSFLNIQMVALFEGSMEAAGYW